MNSRATRIKALGLAALVLAVAATAGLLLKQPPKRVKGPPLYWWDHPSESPEERLRLALAELETPQPLLGQIVAFTEQVLPAEDISPVLRDHARRQLLRHAAAFGRSAELSAAYAALPNAGGALRDLLLHPPPSPLDHAPAGVELFVFSDRLIVKRGLADPATAAWSAALVAEVGAQERQVPFDLVAVVDDDADLPACRAWIAAPEVASPARSARCAESRSRARVPDSYFSDGPGFSLFFHPEDAEGGPAPGLKPDPVWQAWAEPPSVTALQDIALAWSSPSERPADPAAAVLAVDTGDDPRAQAWQRALLLSLLRGSWASEADRAALTAACAERPAPCAALAPLLAEDPPALDEAPAITMDNHARTVTLRLAAPALGPAAEGALWTRFSALAERLITQEQQLDVPYALQLTGYSEGAFAAAAAWQDAMAARGLTGPLPVQLHSDLRLGDLPCDPADPDGEICDVIQVQIVQRPEATPREAASSP